jgi:hypothetical protein
LGNPSPGRYAVDTSSVRRTGQGYSVPERCLRLREGPHCSPGDDRDALWSTPSVVQSGRISPVSVSFLDQANNPRRPVLPDEDSNVSSSACPTSTLLGGMRGWVPRDRLSLPLHGLRVRRYRGEGASRLHQEGRNYTYTALKLSKTLTASVPHPWCRHHFEGTDRRTARYK